MSTINVMSLRGVLFDFDGTLADTASAERNAWPGLADVIARHTPGVDPHELHTRYFRVFEPHWTAYLEGRIDFATYRRNRLTEALEPWREVDDELFEVYRQEKRRGVEGLQLFDDAIATLRYLRTLGLRVGLLTNGPSSLQRHKLEVTGIEPELDAVAISEEIGVAKPEPQAFYRAAAMIGCRPAEVAMVGDSPEYDIAGAIAAGLALAVLVRRGLDVAADGATVIETLGELPAAMGVGPDRSGPYRG
jgi:putative hydrolase of the HAD superfamily